MTRTNFSVVAADTPEAQAALAEIADAYDLAPLEEASIVIVLGGDGFMLETMRASLGRDISFYGMNRGTVGFLMNEFDFSDLPARLARAETVNLHPLRMHAETIKGATCTALTVRIIFLS